VPYYHILVEIDDDKRLEDNLSPDEIISIVDSYHNDDVFMCDGSFVRPSEISRIKIYETDKPKAQDDLSFLIERFSRDVTKRFIKHPPRKKETERVLKKEKTLKESRIPSKKVFIVHGRNHKPMKELKTMVKEFALDPVVLHEKPSASKTIVEKLEKYSDVGYAFVILTPDDGSFNLQTLEEIMDRIEAIRLSPKREDNVLFDSLLDILTKVARQNVILEFGYFMGLLGRERYRVAF
jgi:predicted nucleotide-binding protein